MSTERSHTTFSHTATISGTGQIHLDDLTQLVDELRDVPPDATVQLQDHHSQRDGTEWSITVRWPNPYQPWPNKAS